MVLTMKVRLGIAPLLACVATSAMILVATPLSARADDLLDDRHPMPLINIGSGKCFEPTPQVGFHGDEPIQQRTCSPTVMRPDGTDDRPIQRYQFQSQGQVDFNDQGFIDWRIFGAIGRQTTGYLIRNLDTDLCLEVRDGSKSDSAVVQQSTCKAGKSARSMLWYVEPGDFPGTFKVRNFNSDRCLDVRGGSWADGAQLQQYHCMSNNLAQNFSQKFLELWMDLNGRWTDGSTRSAVISSGAFGHIVIDMAAFSRPAARGWFSAPSTITVNFPDDATFTGTVSPLQHSPTKITWSNGSVWVKKP